MKIKELFPDETRIKNAHGVIKRLSTKKELTDSEKEIYTAASNIIALQKKVRTYISAAGILLASAVAAFGIYQGTQTNENNEPDKVVEPLTETPTASEKPHNNPTHSSNQLQIDPTKIPGYQQPVQYPTPIYKNQFKSSEYIPPQGLKIAEKHIEAGSNRTVIIIPEAHAVNVFDVQGLQEHWEKGIYSEAGVNSQRKNFQIITDAVEKYGTAVVYYEGYPPFGMTVKETMTKLATLPRHEWLKTIMDESSQEKREEIANEILKGNFNSGVYLAASVCDGNVQVYPTEEEIKASIPEMSYMERMLSLQEYDKEGSCKMLMEENEALKDSDISTKEAIQKFKDGKRGADVINCYCGFHEGEKYVWKRFYDKRLVLAAQREANLAAANNAPFVFLVTGALHLPQQIETLKKAEVSYIVIDSMVEKNELPDVRFYLDDKGKTCTAWAKKNQKTVSFIKDQIDGDLDNY